MTERANTGPTDGGVGSAKAGTRKTSPDVSVVLVSFNSDAFIGECLQSLCSSGVNCLVETILVDNGSSDETVDKTREIFPWVHIIQNSTNRGFAAGSNQGIRASTGRYVLLLNCDTVVNGGAIDAMVQFLDLHPDAGAVGGTLLNLDRTFQSGWSTFSNLWQEFLIALHVGAVVRPGYPSHRTSSEVVAVDWLTAACLMVRREAVNQVGYFDEDYFMYSEEVDLQFRLRRAGWKVYYLPQVNTIHHGGGDQDRWSRRRMVYRGKILFYKKNYGLVRELALRSLLAGVSIAKLAIWSAIGLLRPSWPRTTRELRSNVEVLQMCFSARLSSSPARCSFCVESDHRPSIQ